MQGGIKAVVHTDAWQVVVMFLSVLVVTILGTVAMGGFENVFDRAVKGGRIDFFNFNPSMYERHTFWAVLIGGMLSTFAKPLELLYHLLNVNFSE